MHMGLDKNVVKKIQEELTQSKIVMQCAMRHGTVGDPSAMKICYLLRHYPDLSVSEVAELVGLSVSAASRCLTRLKLADVVISSRQARTVRYQLQDNTFTRHLVSQMEPLR